MRAPEDGPFLQMKAIPSIDLERGGGEGGAGIIFWLAKKFTSLSPAPCPAVVGRRPQRSRNKATLLPCRNACPFLNSLNRVTRSAGLVKLGAAKSERNWARARSCRRRRQSSRRTSQALCSKGGWGGGSGEVCLVCRGNLIKCTPLHEPKGMKMHGQWFAAIHVRNITGVVLLLISHLCKALLSGVIL